MKSKLQKAIDNNHGIYEAVFDSQRIPWTKNDDIWYSISKVPPFNSNLVTRSASWQPEEIFKSIDQASIEEKWKTWSIKDSFNVLDLKPQGFEKLFDAQWLYLEAGKFLPTENTSVLSYVLVRNEMELQQWREFWSKSNEGANAVPIYRNAIMGDKNLSFMLGMNKVHEVVSIFLLNRTDDVVGISNFYAPGTLLYWSDAIKYIQHRWGPIDIVGYERKALLDELQVIGVEAVGDLSVWLKKNG